MSIELADVRARWQNQRQTLLRSNSNNADEELARVIHFAQNHPIISNIIQLLRSNEAYKNFDTEIWIKERETSVTRNPGFSLDETERCAQSLKILEWATEKYKTGSNGLWSLGMTTYVGSSRSITDHIHSAIEVIFDPLYNYIDSELRSLGTLITPVDIVKDIQSLVDNESSVRYPETHKLLTDAYKQLFTLTSDSSGASWYQIGFSCRAVLVKFGNEIFDPSYVPAGIEQPKGDDASSKLKWTVRHFLKLTKVGDTYRDAIEKIIQANWDFVCTVGHRQESVRESDARLALLYTYTTISIINRIILLKN